MTVCYTKTTDTPLSYKISDPNTYSAEETLVGKWFGEDLFQRTIVKTWKELVTNTDSDYRKTINDVDNSNMSCMITGVENGANGRVKEIFCRNSSNKWNPLIPHSGDYATCWNFMYNADADSGTGGIYITDDAKYVLINWKSLPWENNFDLDDSEFFITVQYTKTA